MAPTLPQRWMARVHAALYARSGGVVGHNAGSVPTLVLHTVGRRSGTPREAPLAYGRDGSSYLVTASNWGHDAPPAWLLNLRGPGPSSIQVGSSRLAVTATEVWPSDPSYARLWEIVNAVNHGRYRRYAAGTRREIPVVRLDPVDT
ncbi:nitroreductase/quinone reductase family protein [Tenggerimyces flavus]|uniref:Nitroreductase/quinone reductase family protein n=1 Tax=Tenggerimyces flavus TaxID=1708749 RepID=A0ABV7YBH4_9ACTN|nr:nitroreductase/quinone reductase family protein [Tenggerimyces flavus]MBM7786580.1 deazaflavin-dependent oxidoreductase (nitroreductase family) [Tenggerimyces flavus]